MVELFTLLLLISSIAPAFMPTTLALRRSIGSFVVLALIVFFVSIGTPDLMRFTLGGPEALIIAGFLSIVLLLVSAGVRALVLHARSVERSPTEEPTGEA